MTTNIMKPCSKVLLGDNTKTKHNLRFAHSLINVCENVLLDVVIAYLSTEKNKMLDAKITN